MSSYVADFNTRNQILTASFLKQGYRYHKLRKTFPKFYRRHNDLVSKFNTGLKYLLKQGLSEPEFYGDLQVRFINFIPMQFFHKSLHTPLYIPTSAARYLMSKILTITAGINQKSMLKLPVKAIAENIAQQKFCGKMNLS